VRQQNGPDKTGRFIITGAAIYLGIAGAGGGRRGITGAGGLHGNFFFQRARLVALPQDFYLIPGHKPGINIKGGLVFKPVLGAKFWIIIFLPFTVTVIVLIK